jgi:Flp pilus assembly protein TadD
MDPSELNAESLLAEASAALEAGDAAAAIELLRGAIEADPHNALYRFQLGNVLAHEGRSAEADALYREAYRLDANIANFPLRVGLECAQAGMLEQAASCLELALSFDRNNAEALICLGDVLRRQGRESEAIRMLETARNLAPDSPDAWLNLGVALEQADRFNEAGAALQTALRLRPGNPIAWNNLGMVLKQLGRLPEALAVMNELVKFAPGFAEARFNRAMLLLLTGDFEQGWTEYEWRRKNPIPEGRGLRERLHSGLPLQDQTVLLHAEQGLGDLIQFVRYAAWLHARGAKVLVECRPGTHELIRTVPGVAGVTTAGTFPEFDWNARLLSLPALIHPGGGALPAPAPYMQADAQRVAHWEERLDRDGRLRVGLVWAGNPEHANDRRRSMPLSELRPILSHPNVAVYSLQTGPAAAEFRAQDGESSRDWGVESLSETAAMMMCLDLVITVDTMPAHLAGALGKPVWTLLSFSADWRWGVDREDTPWYPTMRLLRQPHLGDYRSVVQRVADELRDLRPSDATGVKQAREARPWQLGLRGD